MQHGAVIILFAIMIIAAGAGIIVTKTMTVYKDRALYFSDKQVNDLVGNYIDIEEIRGRGQSNGYVEYIYIGSRLRQESEPLHFNETLIHVVVNGQDAYYNYDKNIDCNLNPYFGSSQEYLSNSSNSNSYGVKFSIKGEGDEHSTEFITPGDYVVFCAPLAGPLGGGEEVRIAIVAENAGKKILEFDTQDVLAGEWVEIYQKLV